MREEAFNFFAGALGFCILGAILFGTCMMKDWRYEECLKVGHPVAYCKAEYIGCFGK